MNTAEAIVLDVRIHHEGTKGTKAHEEDDSPRMSTNVTPTGQWLGKAHHSCRFVFIRG
jgi:hypothetical protein